MNPAPNLVFIGPTGAGKTSLGRRVAQRLGLEFVDSDQAIERRTGARVALVFELEGEAGFRQRESEMIAELCAGSRRLIATGAGAVLDPGNRRVMHSRGFVVHLDIDVEQQLHRLSRDRSRPLLQAPDRRERLEAMARQRQPLYAGLRDLHFTPARGSAARVTRDLVAAIRAHWLPGDKETPDANDHG
ncbi:MAG: shikimate kinase [Lysobacteraceae bacterium]